MQTITFYAYKGGTGRTLALANAARYLARLGQSVFAIDLDLEAPGLHHKLGVPAAKSKITVSKGAVDIIHGFYQGGVIPDSLAPYTVEVPSEESRDGKIRLLPAGNVLTSTYWRHLAELNWHEMFYKEGAEGVPFFLELKERIRAEFSPDFLLIDARTGITEVGGVATTLLPDLVVCLLLHNIENLEGAREILRSISQQSKARSKVIRIVPVLSRIPIGQRSDASDREERLVEEVRAYLSEPVTEKGGGLNLPSVFVLHSEESLTVRESLRVGGTISVNDSPLLRDYLKLFAQIIPSEQVEPHLDRLIEAATRDLLEKPTKVQADLEALADFCPHPKSYLALLKFYRLRDVGPSKMMRTATRYWELSGRSDDPILWEVVSSFFGLDHKSYSIGRVGREEQHIAAITQMAEAVWSASGITDSVIGLRLVDALFQTKRPQQAVSVINRILESPTVDENVVAVCIRKLVNNQKVDSAHAIVQQFRPRLFGNVDFQVAWAVVIAQREDAVEAKSLLESKETKATSIMAKNPDVYYRLLMLADRQDELESMLTANLNKTLKNQDLDEIMALYKYFVILGKADDFENRAMKLLPPEKADRLLSLLQETYPGRRHQLFRTKEDPPSRHFF